MKREVEIKLDLLKPLILEKEYDDVVKSKFLEMIEDIKQSEFIVDIYGEKHIIQTTLQNINKNSYMRYYTTFILNFQVDVEKVFSDLKIYTSDKKEELKLTEEEKISYQDSIIIDETEKYVMDLIFAMNLAYPGFFEIGEKRVYLNQKEEISFRKDLILVNWLDTYINFLKNKWPEIHMLKFERVWRWLNTRTNYMEGISKTAIDRALNALTYTMEDASYEKIFYVLMGLEAIYNDNDSNGIAEQIRAKTVALLKRPDMYKRKISRFYDNRSKFIHGKLNFPNKYCPYDASDEFQEFYFNKYIETVNSSMSILIATIQEYIIQDKSKLKTRIEVDLEN